MSDTQSLTLPTYKSKAKSKGWKLPKPPKFSKWEIFLMIWATNGVIWSIITLSESPVTSTLFLVANASMIGEIVYSTLKKREMSRQYSRMVWAGFIIGWLFIIIPGSQ